MSASLKVLIPIALGGAFGAVARYLTSLTVHGIMGTGFPYATLLVNVAGSLMIGILYALIVESAAELGHYRGPLIVGLLGAFTTYSTFSLETIHLIESAELMKAALNVFLNVALCLAACWCGLAIARTHL